jgi:hypothetical protein
VPCICSSLCANANTHTFAGAFGLGALVAPLALVALGSDIRLAFWAIAALSAACAVAFLAVPPPPLPAKQQPPVWSEQDDDDCCEEAALTAAAGEPTPALTTLTAAAPCLSLGVSTLLPLTGLFIALSVGAEVSFGAFVVPYAMGQDAVSNTNIVNLVHFGLVVCLVLIALTSCTVVSSSSSSSSAVLRGVQ